MEVFAVPNKDDSSRLDDCWAEFAVIGSGSSFDRIIRVHLNFVYAAALRQVRDPHLAQDVTQAVFMVLARRSKSIGHRSALPGWLFKTTRYCAANAIKLENRRLRHERAAASQRSEITMPSTDNVESDPLLNQLDAALADLGRSDRDAILFRYLDGREMVEVARALGVSEAAARKRVNRAVEKLRAVFARRGVAVASIALGLSLSAAGAQAAPAATVAAVSSASIAAAGSSPTALIANSVVRVWMWMQAGIIAGVTTTIALIIGASVLLVHADQSTRQAASTAPAQPAQPAVVAAIPSGPRTFALTVVDKATGNLMIDVPVVVQVDNVNPTEERTDASGNLAIEIPRVQPGYFGIRVSQPGYSPVKLEWRNDVARDPAPDSYNLALEKGTAIGGVIRDTEDNPIAGTEVFLIVNKVSLDRHENSNIWDQKVTTDSQGRWRYNLAPEKLEDVSIRLHHPGFVSDSMYDSTSSRENPDVYRTLDHLLVMHKGLAVVGRVVNDFGGPISGARVKQGDDRWGSNYPSTRTDMLGNFRFGQADPGSMTLTVEANGYSPDLKQITVNDDLGLVEFKLTEAQPLRARVVDTMGQPVPGVKVVADTWRNKRTLDWSGKTDADGYFDWENAPSDVVTFHLLKEGFMANRDAELTAGKSDQVATLRLPLTVKGTVVDASTGKAIPAFRMVFGREFRSGNSVYWNRERSGRFTDGAYETHFIEPFKLGFIRIEADNYAPAVSRGFKIDEGVDPQLELDFKLEPAKDIRAVVLAPDGSLAVGAKAALATKDHSIGITDGSMGVDARRQSFISKAGSDGMVSFPAQESNAVMVVVADAGYALVALDDLKKSADQHIKLTAWSRVEATFKIGSKPFAGQPVCALCAPGMVIQDCYANFESFASTDAAGHAVFDRVPAGACSLQDWHMSPDGMWGERVRTDCVVAPAQTLKIQLGGTGRPVTGRLIAPGDYPGKPDWMHNAFGTVADAAVFTRNQRPPALPYPENWAQMSFAQRRAWWSSPAVVNFNKQPAPQQLLNPHPILIQGDGRFIVNDLPAGDYRLNVSLGTGDTQSADGTAKIVSINKDFTIDKIPGGQTDEPLDIGSLQLTRSEAQGQSTSAPTTAPAAVPGSPADVQQRYDQAVANGEAEAALKLVDTSNPAVEAMVRGDARLALANKHLVDVMFATLGEQDAIKLLGSDPRKTEVPHSRAYSWVITGDQAIPSGPAAPYRGCTMVLLDGKWKINAGELILRQPGGADALQKTSQNQIDLLNTLTQAVIAGNVTTREQMMRILYPKDHPPN